jgi:hypothetical protein
VRKPYWLKAVDQSIEFDLEHVNNFHSIPLGTDKRVVDDDKTK